MINIKVESMRLCLIIKFNTFIRSLVFIRGKEDKNAGMLNGKCTEIHATTGASLSNISIPKTSTDE